MTTYLTSIITQQHHGTTSGIVDGSSNKTTFDQLIEESQNISKWSQAYLPDYARVGIFMRSKKYTLKCITSSILANHIYVPLDFEAPLNRNKSIIQTCALHGLWVEIQMYNNLSSELPKHTHYKYHDYYLIVFTEVKNIEIPKNVAYILNTSGSTGTPKGVMITHSNVRSFIEWAHTKLELSSHDIIASIAPFHFDLSVFDLFITFKNRTSLILFDTTQTKNPRLLAQQLAHQRVTVLYATPTLLRLLLHHGKIDRYDFSALRYVIFAGEIFPIEDLKRLKQLWSQATFFNWYGPTETNVCTYYQLPNSFEERTTPFPIGKACIDNTIKITQNNELLVSGISVFAGYINAPIKTQQVFSTDENGQSWYHTGDLVRIDENKDMVFVGRKDRMVKRNGYRIELDEIEYWMHQLEQVGQCAVVEMKSSKQVEIVCFYTTLNSIENDSIRAYLIKNLSLYMLPNHFIKLESIPLTNSQKVDYQALKIFYNTHGK